MKARQLEQLVNNNLETALMALNDLNDLEATERCILRAFYNLQRLANVTARA
jgi:hypothetical protein